MRSADLLSRAMLYHSTKVRFAKFLLVGLIVLMMGFVGVLVNDHTLGHYLDEPGFEPLWARLEQLGVRSPAAPIPRQDPGCRAHRPSTVFRSR